MYSPCQCYNRHIIVNNDRKKIHVLSFECKHSSKGFGNDGSSLISLLISIFCSFFLSFFFTIARSYINVHTLLILFCFFFYTAARIFSPGLFSFSFHLKYLDLKISRFHCFPAKPNTLTYYKFLIILRNRNAQYGYTRYRFFFIFFLILLTSSLVTTS